jgi:hypothetical protein
MAESDVSKSSWQKNLPATRNGLCEYFSGNPALAARGHQKGKQVSESKRVNSDAKLFHDYTIILPGHP